MASALRREQKEEGRVEERKREVRQRL